ncbi:MAG TPA: ferrous iron transport protein B [Aquaticitalea sp.]|nr:ferrous iron transport protein B [Aquaticitalea sp.]
MSKQINVALIGNPNTGKTSVFNALTGLNQKVGNYPGITVEKKEGVCKLPRGVKAHILDLPGTYSLNASSLDENVVIELLLNKNDKNFPDVAVVVSDVEHLKRNLLLFTQIKDLEIPAILVINMSDRMAYKGISLDVAYLEKMLKTKIALVSTRKKQGVEELKELIANYRELSMEPCLNASEIDPEYFDGLRKAFPGQLLYKLWLVITQDVNFGKTDRNEIDPVADFKTKSKSELKRLQQKETIRRYQFINDTLKVGQTIDLNAAKDLSIKLDRILTHKVWGYVVFAILLLLMFQAIFSWSEPFMNVIDDAFASLSDVVSGLLPEGKLNDLISQGIVPGIGGVVIFVPQIAMLFLFIAILEETGYMSRVVFLMDKTMRRFGLSGKSVVPLISGNACAIPAIMATRNIENWKERLITILVTPLSVCSARLPVYTILISLIVPETKIFGLINSQALALLGMYVLGIVLAIGAAIILNKIIKMKGKSYFVVEMPTYKLPLLKNVAYTVLEKTKAFVINAGKIILAVSIILWFLATHGGKTFSNAETIIDERATALNLSEHERDTELASFQLENSYIGMMGKAIEPVIKPLGYDWKIGIAIITSFAAREVFVGTLATIYSVENAEDEGTIRSRMASATFAGTGEKVFTVATGVSLLLFYAIALQCAATVAIVRKETNSWKWPLIQLIGLGVMAYLFALIGFSIFK